MQSSQNNCCIVIPVYKPDLTANESASLKQLLSVVPTHKIIFMCSKSFDLKNYISIIKLFDHIQIGIERFSGYYFSSVSSYNKLLLSANFYKRFTSYKFILLYQLDAWIFKDELDYWCEQDYDYIGAPWFEGFKNDEEKQFIGAGNGGFSLRKVKSHIKVLTTFSYLVSPKNVIKTRLKEVHGIVSFIQEAAAFLVDLSIKNNTYYLFNNYKLNEDFFWGDLVPSKFTWFKVADVRSAIKFSFECNPRKLYKLNNFQMPFGCHAWEKYEPDFWKDFIKVNTI